MVYCRGNPALPVAPWAFQILAILVAITSARSLISFFSNIRNSVRRYEETEVDPPYKMDQEIEVTSHGSRSPSFCGAGEFQASKSRSASSRTLIWRL